jgi:hypothetical protein
MKHVEAQVRKAWVNGYLDLYLYAGTIGDTQWQCDIMDTLRNADKEITDALFKLNCGNNMTVSIAKSYLYTEQLRD